MDQTKYENVMFFMTILNIVAGLVSISLATLAILALRDAARNRTLPSPIKVIRFKDTFPHIRVNGWCDSCESVGDERYNHVDRLQDIDPGIYYNETPTEVTSKQVVRRSPMLSAQGRREFYG